MVTWVVEMPVIVSLRETQFKVPIVGLNMGKSKFVEDASVGGSVTTKEIGEAGTPAEHIHCAMVIRGILTVNRMTVNN